MGPSFPGGIGGTRKSLSVAWIENGEVRHSVGLKTRQVVLSTFEDETGPCLALENPQPLLPSPLWGPGQHLHSRGEAEVVRIHGVVHRNPFAPTPLPTSLSLRGEQDVLAFHSFQQ